jgi:hypothetical protein
VQRRRIDPQHLGGARLVPLFAREHPLDVRTLDGLERGVRGGALGDQRFAAALGVIGSIASLGLLIDRVSRN